MPCSTSGAINNSSTARKTKKDSSHEDTIDYNCCCFRGVSALLVSFPSFFKQNGNLSVVPIREKFETANTWFQLVLPSTDDCFAHVTLTPESITP